MSEQDQDPIDLTRAEHNQTADSGSGQSRPEELMAREAAYLDRVQSYLRQRQAYLAEDTARRLQENIDLKAEAYEEHLELREPDTNGQADSAHVQAELALGYKIIEDQEREEKILPKLIKQPYFGAVRFRFADDEEGELYHIGLKDILDTDHFCQYVIDWRAPLSTLYYNVNELGPTSFKNQHQVLTGDLEAKYQIIIENGELVRVIDTQEQVLDEILQMVLSSMGHAQMKAIAQTLQHEQNLIIRSEMNRTLLIQGVAGSGKTSIALHRAAYMMYVNPDLHSDNILLISPSESFATYISGVLPDLGEENVRHMTILQMLRQELADLEGKFYAYQFAPAAETAWQQMADFSWVTYCREFAKFMEETVFEAKDIKTQYIQIPAQTLRQLYQINYKHLPPFKRRTAILNHLHDLISNEADFAHIQEFLEESLRGMYLVQELLPIYEIFRKWLAEEKGVMLVSSPDQALSEADLGNLALLKILLFGPEDQSWVKHLIIDEMQDLLPVEHEALRLLCKVPRTILGDINQAVKFRVGEDYLAQLESVYRADPIKVQTYQLNTSYRSTRQITEFSRRILADRSIQPLDRQGAPVRCRRFAAGRPGRLAMENFVFASLQAWQNRGYRTVAVVCKTYSQAATLRSALEELQNKACTSTEPAAANPDPIAQAPAGDPAAALPKTAGPAPSPMIFNDYLRQEDGFAATICSLQEAKGVEFDAVLVYDVAKENYRQALDQTRLYVACTRALHELLLTCQGPITPFLSWLETERDENTAFIEDSL